MLNSSNWLSICAVVKTKPEHETVQLPHRVISSRYEEANPTYYVQGTHFVNVQRRASNAYAGTTVSS